jgi:hypothetical protein
LMANMRLQRQKHFAPVNGLPNQVVDRKKLSRLVSSTFLPHVLLARSRIRQPIQLLRVADLIEVARHVAKRFAKLVKCGCFA